MQLITVRMYTGFFLLGVGGEVSQMQILATVKHISFLAEYLAKQNGCPQIFIWTCSPMFFKLMNILLTLPLGTSALKRSLRQWTCLQSRISDISIVRQMRIAPQLTKHQTLDISDFGRYGALTKNKLLPYPKLSAGLYLLRGGRGGHSPPLVLFSPPYIYEIFKIIYY